MQRYFTARVKNEIEWRIKGTADCSYCVDNDTLTIFIKTQMIHYTTHYKNFLADIHKGQSPKGIAELVVKDLKCAVYKKLFK